MNDQYLKPEKVKTPIEESGDAKLKAAIKKFSCQTKTYPPTEWWDWDSGG